MAHINLKASDLSLDEPTMIEGLPGVGLVGKIAADHLVDTFEMTHYANVHCDGLPPLARYSAGDSELAPPVRLYADEARDLMVLQSDVPVAPQAAVEFATCLTDWFATAAITPIFLSGLPRQKGDAPPSMYGVATGAGAELLADAGIEEPNETGVVSGPTGALLADAIENDRTSVGLIVESDPQFPDPEAARVLLKRGIEPLADIEVPIDELVDRADEIQETKEQLAQRMQEVGDESSQATPLRMYQ